MNAEAQNWSSWVKLEFLGNIQRFRKRKLGSLDIKFSDFIFTMGLAFAPRWLPIVLPPSFSDLASTSGLATFISLPRACRVPVCMSSLLYLCSFLSVLIGNALSSLPWTNDHPSPPYCGLPFWACVRNHCKKCIWYKYCSSQQTLSNLERKQVYIQSTIKRRREREKECIYCVSLIFLILSLI